MKHSLEIVPFQPRNLRRVLAIERACFAADAYPAALFQELFRRCGELFFVARAGPATIGYVVSCVEGDSAEVVSIAVDPSLRRRGVGSALMAHTLGRLKTAGVRSVRLMVRASAAGTIRFYRRFGFRPAGRAPGYYEDGAEGLRMQLRL